MDRKTFVIDVSVLIHDPHSLIKFKNNDIIIPFSVLEELDKLKRFTDEFGKSSRDVLNFINSLDGNFFEGIKLKNNSNIFLYKDFECRIGKKDFPFSIDNAKNRILYVAYVLKNRKKNVVLISKDLVFREKAKAIGIDAKDYDSLKESYDTIYKGIRKLEIDKTEIDKVLLNGFIETIEKFYPNEYCILNSKENSSVLCKYNSNKKILEDVKQLTIDLWGIKPLNYEQRSAIDLLLRDDVKLITLIGQAGTGKTLISLVSAFHKVFDKGIYKKILASRPIMPMGKDIGYLPGTKEEKILPWMKPIYDNIDFICEGSIEKEESKKEIKRWILDSNKIEMEALTYIRGRSLYRTFIIIDEAQNLSPHEAKTIISRVGIGSKIVFTGDPTQIDNPYLDRDSNALTYIVDKFKNHEIYGNIFFEKTERSKLSALAAEIL